MKAQKGKTNVLTDTRSHSNSGLRNKMIASVAEISCTSQNLKTITKKKTTINQLLEER